MSRSWKQCSGNVATFSLVDAWNQRRDESKPVSDSGYKSTIEHVSFAEPVIYLRCWWQLRRTNEGASGVAVSEIDCFYHILSEPARSAATEIREALLPKGVFAEGAWCGCTMPRGEVGAPSVWSGFLGLCGVHATDFSLDYPIRVSYSIAI
jgi:hypothetical protein